MKFFCSNFEIYMKNCFYSLGLSIGTHPKRFIFFLLILTSISSIGFLRFHQINNARVTFTAHDSPSHKEGAMFFNFLKQNGTLHMIEVLIKAKDGGNLLRPDYREQLTEMTNEIIKNITVKEKNGKELSYFDMCEPYCEKNDAFYAVLNILSTIDLNSTTFKLTYPSSELLGRNIFLANNIYDVTKLSETNVLISFRTVVLRYYLTNSNMKRMIDFEDQLIDLLYNSNKYPLLYGQAGSDNMVSKEVKKLGSTVAPYLSVSLLLLCIFLIICSIRYRRNESKPVEACLGALIPVFSGITTIGMVSSTGLAFQSIIVSTLFLILAIGIDDIFIILAAWHRTDHQLDIPHRIAETVREAGCSMTVTTITNLISFGNGILSTTPVLQTFAIYSSVASVICFIYQLIIFPAIIAIRAPNEYKNVKNQKSFLPENFDFIKKLSNFADQIWKKLAFIVEKNWMRTMTIVILIGYWYLSVFGIFTMETDLSIQKMGNKESRIVQFKDDIDKTLKEMQSVAILINSPGDLRNQSNLEGIKQLINDFENASYSFGKESTICWIQQYLDFLEFYEKNEEEEEEEAEAEAEKKEKKFNFTYIDIPSFLKSETYFKPMIRYNQEKCLKNEPFCIESFIFTTGFTTLTKYNEMFPLIQEWRRIAAKYPQFDVYPYTERSNFADQTNDMVNNIWQTVLSEVICMAISFIFFIPDLVSIFAAVFSLLSVNIGVFGFLSLWNVGMDPVSTASLLMSIGFSVDISAHISYHYYTVNEPTPRMKLEHVFTHIGWPTMQGGLSTMLAMMPILLCPSYLGMVFLKTVILVSIFGLVHGLIILPVFLSIFSDIALLFRKRIHPSPSDIKSKNGSSNDSITHLPRRITIQNLGENDNK